MKMPCMKAPLFSLELLNDLKPTRRFFRNVRKNYLDWPPTDDYTERQRLRITVQQSKAWQKVKITKQSQQVFYFQHNLTARYSKLFHLKQGSEPFSGGIRGISAVIGILLQPRGPDKTL